MECIICKDDENGLVELTSCCKQAAHHKCLDQWYKNQRYRGLHATCPHCLKEIFPPPPQARRRITVTITDEEVGAATVTITREDFFMERVSNYRDGWGIEKWMVSEQPHKDTGTIDFSTGQRRR
ncbi:predicted protein [Nematostella vectensis]|uniref:RING-type domain-containing protein n=1 Tax=Nematostella vectensis TaxID=45351 RepID=A7RWR4_NEMVE|nr:predicted protein [Nematostella vectensis]|eukprot:XP_001636077.1 predicted protein [Nematostella vectensis]